ncbi:hypothetical protein AMJ40_06710 [candidate division TA06 bacterium DG_26]|uniref:Uncharacterized protein n=1 Tax=candidate division TA06 bacterium DG_26 TaxID=1703771 RepID=A0A0S7WFF3_UNCT6|nr:MAG: hypothetical protein AMJ40_06710 [candidate division TA06 bacterium DG_26]
MAVTKSNAASPVADSQSESVSTWLFTQRLRWKPGSASLDGRHQTIHSELVPFTVTKFPKCSTRRFTTHPYILTGNSPLPGNRGANHPSEASHQNIPSSPCDSAEVPEVSFSGRFIRSRKWNILY